MKIRLLHIDDSEVDARVVRYLIQQMEMSVDLHWVPSLDDLQEINANDFDAVLLNMCLTVTRGRETMNAYNKYGFKLPLIVLTGMEDRKLGREMLALGAQEYMNKATLSFELLEKTIEYAIERY
ncbi:MAG: response regulator, partial [Lentisphaeria bacterium]|nr:response regulator [Lentisphaeria bacterium]NQZ67465.1 response regulator [Lentisphaeria bacterium]